MSTFKQVIDAYDRLLDLLAELEPSQMNAANHEELNRYTKKYLVPEVNRLHKYGDVVGIKLKNYCKR